MKRARLEKHAALMRLRNLERREAEIIQYGRGPKAQAALRNLWDQAQKDYLLIDGPKQGNKTCPAPITASTLQKSFEF